MRNYPFQVGDAVRIRDEFLEKPSLHLRHIMQCHAISYETIGNVVEVLDSCIIVNIGIGKEVLIHSDYFERFDDWMGAHKHPLTSIFLGDEQSNEQLSEVNL